MNEQTPQNPPFAPSTLLGRLGFEFIPSGSLEEKRIRDEIHRLTMARLLSMSPIRLSQSELDHLYKYTIARRPLLALGVTHLGAGRLPWHLPMKAKIAWPLDILYSRLYRTGCIGVILLHRLARRLVSFCTGVPYNFDVVERPKEKAEPQRGIEKGDEGQAK